MNIANFSKRILILLKPLSLVFILSGCSSLFFYPSSIQHSTPEQWHIAYENIYLKTTDNETLHAWWLPIKNREKMRGTIYYLHGNAGNISSHLKQVAWLHKAGYQLLLLDYRGYGQSTGVPVLPDTFIDIENGFTWLQKKLAQQFKLHHENNLTLVQKPVFIVGQSLGASMAGYVVAKNSNIALSIHGIILDSPFASYTKVSQEVAAKHWSTWLFQHPVKLFMPSAYNLIDHIEKISPTPLLLLHSQDDKIISLQHSQQLFSQAKAPKEFYIYEGRHISALLQEKHRTFILQYLDKLTENKRALHTQ